MDFIWLGQSVSPMLPLGQVFRRDAQVLLSLFCGAGGLDLGFEDEGWNIGLALDKKRDSIASYRMNRQADARAYVEDVRGLSLERLDELWGGTCKPSGLIGGPPCQSFSQANQSRFEDDPRHTLPLIFADLLSQLNARHPVPFFVMENVPGLREARHSARLAGIKARLEAAGYAVADAVLNSYDHRTPQRRRRLFIVGVSKLLYPGKRWVPPKPDADPELLTVASAIKGLPEPVLWAPGTAPEHIPYHPNHWAMQPKSRKFQIPGMLRPGVARHRSFKTLRWDRPSLTVAYGNREVHVHPDCKRRLSVHEALLLQGFPASYVLTGSLSSQIAQVSEAVPPPLAAAVARSLTSTLTGRAESQEQQELPFVIPAAA